MKTLLPLLLLSGCSLFLSPNKENFKENNGRNCNDGVDNDGDDLIDGEDQECVPVCGDGILGTGEACDDSNTESADGCSADCATEDGFTCAGAPSVCAPLCGDGLKVGSEECDDGNTTSGDGCSSVCRIDGGPGCGVTGAELTAAGANGHCYASFPTGVPYQVAKELCESHLGHLITITDQAEVDISAQLTSPNRPYWIGAVQDRGFPNVFLWATYEELLIDLFVLTPGDAQECAILMNDGWQDSDCTINASPLCEIETPIIVPKAPTGVDSISIISLDADGNGTRDIAASAINSGVLTVLENDGFGTLSSLQDFDLGAGVNSEISEDLDGDGDEDLIASHFGNKGVFFFENIGNGTFAAPTLLFSATHSPTDLISTDVNDDARADIILTTTDINVTGFVEVFLRGGEQLSFLTSIEPAITTDANPFELVSSDFNGDTKEDIAIVVNSSNKIEIYSGNGDGTFSLLNVAAACGSPFSLGLGDVNGDTQADLVTACEDDPNGVGGALYIGNGFGDFSSEFFPLDGTPLVARLGDLNRDSKDDLLVSQSTKGTIAVFMSNGGVFDFSSPTQYTVGGNPGELAIDDFNGDDINDIAVANSLDLSIDMLLNLGGGVLLAPTQ